MFRAVAMSVFVLSNLIVLSSCSSGATLTTPKVSATSPHPTGSTESPSPSTSQTSGASVSVRITSRYTEIFATPLPADPAQAAVISGFRKGQILWDQSLVALHLVGITREYVTGKALTNLDDALAAFIKYNLVPVGVDRLFDTKITSITADSATVTTCDDGASFNNANRTTGQTMPPAPPSQRYTFAVFTMRPVDGHWATSSVTAAAKSAC